MSEILFNRKAHKKMWLWLAKNPNKNKWDWPGWKMYNGQTMENHCFACSYATELQRRLNNAHICSLCPLDFDIPFKKRGSIHEDCLGGLYMAHTFMSAYRSKRNRKMCTKLAREIAKLPVKEGVKCL